MEKYLKEIRFIREYSKQLLTDNPNWSHLSLIKEKETLKLKIGVQAHDDFQYYCQESCLYDLLVNQNSIQVPDEFRKINHSLKFLDDHKFNENIEFEYVPRIHPKFRDAPLGKGPISGGTIGAQHWDTGGSLGGFIEADNGDFYAITAYHVLKNIRAGANVVSPYGSNNKLGRLAWFSEIEGLDIALVKLKDRPTSGSHCGFSIQPNIGIISDKLPVKICSWEPILGSTKPGTIDLTAVFNANKCNGRVIVDSVRVSNTSFTTGDSGSLILTNDDFALGVLTDDCKKSYSFFSRLDFLNKPISLMFPKNKKIQFKNFI